MQMLAFNSHSALLFASLEKALQLTLRAIELFEQESAVLKAESENVEGETSEKPFLPSGARMYYMAGGILLGMKRYQDAIPHLEKAASSCAEWDRLEHSIRKMLVECYKHYMPRPSPDVPNEAADAKMLEMMFFSGVPISEVRPILESYRNVRGNDSLKWNLESTSDSDMSLPFSFSVTFPGSTHATAGDTVSANVTIKSNLSFPVLVKSVTLMSGTGPITVPSRDLTDAQNAEKVLGGGVILLPMNDILFSTEVVLPRDLDKIPSDEGSSGSAVPSARPRTAGISAAGKLVLILLSLQCRFKVLTYSFWHTLQLALALFQKKDLVPRNTMANGAKAFLVVSRYSIMECHYCLFLQMVRLPTKVHYLSMHTLQRKSRNRLLPQTGHPSKRIISSKRLGLDLTVFR